MDLRTVLLIALLSPVLFFAENGRSFAASIQSGPKQVSLLELFSSEGCSSCPPADEWVNKLSSDKGLWKDYVPVVFHVDYWDHLGWKDIYASPQFTRRQREYANSWKSGTIYTPSFVLNGREWRAGKPPGSNKNISGVLAAEISDGRRLTIVFHPDKALRNNEGPWEGHLAVLKSGLRSDIKRGENAGRILKHDFVARDHSSKVLVSKEGGYSAEWDLSDSKEDTIALWVTRQGELIPVQAAGGKF